MEVGYVHSAFGNALCGGCNATTDDFVLVVQTIRKCNVFLMYDVPIKIP